MTSFFRISFKKIKFIPLSIGILCGIGLLLGFLGPFFWILDLLTHFRFHYLLGLLLASLVALLCKQWKCLSLFVILCIINTLAIWPYISPTTQPLDQPNPNQTQTLNILHFNVQSKNTAKDQLVKLINQGKSDLIFLQETTPHWTRQIANQCPAYRIAATTHRWDNFGITMLVKKTWPGTIKHVEIRPSVKQTHVPMIIAKLQIHNRSLNIMSLHTLPPISPKLAKINTLQLAQARRWSDAQSVPHMIIGDLNTTPWSAAFGQLLDSGKLRDIKRGRGLGQTWPTFLPQCLGISIDHCLISQSLAISQWSILPQDLGSDHRPLAVQLHIKSIPTQ